jgi:hypothetical protein
MCRAHNQYVAEQDYGKQAMARYGRSDNRLSLSLPTRSP